MGFTFSTGIKRRPQKVLIYGPEGVGKSTLAAQFPDPVFIDTEDSTGHLDVRRFDPGPQSWTELLAMVDYCARGGLTGGSTLVVDTLDWAEDLCVANVLAERGKTDIEAFGYGNGYKIVSEEFKRLIDALTMVVRAGSNVVCTSHAKVKKFDQPDDMGSYNRWGLKLIDTKSGTSSAAAVKEWADAVLFVNFRSEVITTDEGKRKARGSERVMYTEHDACWDAKNRWGLPAVCPLEYSAISEHIPGKERSDVDELARLMEEACVSEEEVRRAVHSINLRPYEDLVSSYPPELVTRLIVGWGGVVGVIQKLRAEDAEGIPIL